MTLLRRVTTLARANLNDLIDKAEDPEKMIRQVILDMQNQMVQVKTQLAISLADQKVLEKRQKEAQTTAAEWERKAETAISRDREGLARAAIERVVTARSTGEELGAQLEIQQSQVETLKDALLRLQQKLMEAQSRAASLVAQHRRARALRHAGEAHQALQPPDAGETFDRLRQKVEHHEALGQAHLELAQQDPVEQLHRLDRDEKVDAMLAELKAKRQR